MMYVCVLLKWTMKVERERKLKILKATEIENKQDRWINELNQWIDRWDVRYTFLLKLKQNNINIDEKKRRKPMMKKQNKKKKKTDIVAKNIKTRIYSSFFSS